MNKARNKRFYYRYFKKPLVRILFKFPWLFARILNILRKDYGFNEDGNIRELIMSITKNLKITSFVETGSARGNTIYWVANHTFNLPIFSCEKDLKHWQVAKNRTKQAEVLLMRSEHFIKLFHSEFGSFPFFYLDAHSQPDCGQEEDAPLLAELKLIKEYFNHAIILMDDITKEGEGRNKFEDIKVLSEEEGRFIEKLPASDTGYLLWNKTSKKMNLT